MWILESDEDSFLQGKRIWLRPGKRYLFGRVKKEGVAHAIDHKTVSRKHFVIDVAPVKSGQGAQVHVRSKITVADENTKGGTLVDGIELRDGSRELKGKEHTIRPGRYQHELKITWVQVCLSFSFSSREMKSDPLTARRQQLEDLDIKTIIEYVVGETTHAITTKRNTAKGLQALIDGKHIVNNSYIDALVYATTSEDLAEPENLCPLERDFDANWPDPRKHLPPPGKEIIDMPAAASDASFKPDPDRQGLFEDFTFVMCSSDQFDNLLPMVTTGGGKALHFPVEKGKTTADELEQFMRNSAGRKGFGDMDTQQGKGGVILVRWIAKGEMQRWADALADEVAVRINQRPVEQGEFLNIILNKNPALLRRSLPMASTLGDSVADSMPSSRAIKATESSPATTMKAPQSSQQQPASPEPTSPSRHVPARRHASPDESIEPTPKRQRTRGIIRSRFKTFDDGLEDDIVSVPAYQQTQPAAEDDASQLQPSDRDFVSQQPSQGGNTHDESEPLSEDADEGMEDLLPAAAAMNRRRLEMNAKGKKDKTVKHAEAEKPLKKVKKEQEIDVLEAARKRREAEEEALRQDQEALEHAGIDVAKVKNLAVVVEMELPVRSSNVSRVHGQSSDRWDEKWNGRKNFKKFRRQGEGDSRRLVQRVIVPVEEAKQVTYGIGEGYWGGNHKTSKNTQRSSNTSQSQAPSRNPSSQPSAAEPSSPTTSRLQQEAEELVGSIDIDEPRSTRGTGTQETIDRTQTQKTTKRAAAEQQGTAPKRQRTLKTRADDDSEDELKFRFGRRKRA